MNKISPNESLVCTDKYFLTLRVTPGGEEKAEEMEPTRTVDILAFSYVKGGPPPEAKLPGSVIIDCRVLPNVWKNPKIRQVSGKDPRVLEWLLQHHPLQVNYLQDQAMKAARKDGASKVYFGCQHGKHRSVAMALEFSKRLLATNPPEVENE